MVKFNWNIKKTIVQNMFQSRTVIKLLMKQATKRAIKQRTFNLTKEILVWLLTIPGGLAHAFLDYPQSYLGRHYSERQKGQITLRQINRSLRELEKQRLIRKKQYRQRLGYEVTDLGKAKSLKWRYKQQTRQARRDGLSTIVIFDIPEVKRRARNFLRRFLRNNDFMQLQKSVFIGRFYLLKEFDDLLDELNIKGHVSVLEGRAPHIER